MIREFSFVGSAPSLLVLGCSSESSPIGPRPAPRPAHPCATPAAGVGGGAATTGSAGAPGGSGGAPLDCVAAAAALGEAHAPRRVHDRRSRHRGPDRREPEPRLRDRPRGPLSEIDENAARKQASRRPGRWPLLHRRFGGAEPADEFVFFTAPTAAQCARRGPGGAMAASARSARTIVAGTIMFDGTGGLVLPASWATHRNGVARPSPAARCSRWRAASTLA